VNEHNDLELWSMLPLLVPGQRAQLVPFSIDSNQKMKWYILSLIGYLGGRYILLLLSIKEESHIISIKVEVDQMYNSYLNIFLLVNSLIARKINFISHIQYYLFRKKAFKFN
jgi:hypothetical protein